MAGAGLRVRAGWAACGCGLGLVDVIWRAGLGVRGLGLVDVIWLGRRGLTVGWGWAAEVM